MRTLIFLFLAFSLVSTITKANVTKNQKDNGSFYASISIGLGVSEEGTLELRKTLQDLFLKRQGGYYKQAFDISDYSENKNGELKVSKSEIQSAFELLNKSLERSKRRNPYQERTVVLSLTGHGLTSEEGKFSFAINRWEELSGKELVELVEKLNAEKIIFIMQSCQSGSVVNSYFPKLVEDLQSRVSISSKIKGQNKSFAVLTPVNRYVNSPIFTWENILRKSFHHVADKNQNERVSIEEWYNAIKKISVRSSEFSPISAVQEDLVLKRMEKMKINENTKRRMFYYIGRLFGGIDPQLFSVNFDAKETIFLTQKGASQLKKGILAPIPLANRPPKIDREHELFEKQFVDSFFEIIRILGEGELRTHDELDKLFKEKLSGFSKPILRHSFDRVFGEGSTYVDRLFGAGHAFDKENSSHFSKRCSRLKIGS